MLEKAKELIKELVPHNKICDCYGCNMVNEILSELEEAEERIEKLEDSLQKILNWIHAYPLEVFPEPDMKKAAKVLEEAGISLDSISASNMRHVLTGIKDIIEKSQNVGQAGVIG